MLIGVFRANRPGGLFLLPLLLALLWPGAAPRTWAPQDVPPGMPLARIFQGALAQPWSEILLSAALVIICCLLLADLSNRNALLGQRNYLPALYLPILLALWPGGLHVTPALLGMPFVLIAARAMLAPGGRGAALMPLFDAGMLLAVATLFNLSYGFLIVAVWASLSVMRPFQWREYVMPTLGFLVVLFLAWGLLRLWPVVAWDPIASLKAGAPRPWVRHWMHDLVLMVWAVFAGLVFMAHVYGDYSRSVMQAKNIRAAVFALSLSMVLMAGLEMFLLRDRVQAVMIAVPLALLGGHSLSGERTNGWGEAAFWGLLLLALWGRWIG